MDNGYMSSVATLQDAVGFADDVKGMLEFLFNASRLDNISNPFVETVQSMLPEQIAKLNDVITYLEEQDVLRTVDPFGKKEIWTLWVLFINRVYIVGN